MGIDPYSSFLLHCAVVKLSSVTRLAWGFSDTQILLVSIEMPWNLPKSWRKSSDCTDRLRRQPRDLRCWELKMAGGVKYHERVQGSVLGNSSPAALVSKKGSCQSASTHHMICGRPASCPAAQTYSGTLNSANIAISALNTGPKQITQYMCAAVTYRHCKTVGPALQVCLTP